MDTRVVSHQNNSLELHHITKAYKQNKESFPVLKNLSFVFKQGQTTSILGPSGCGKTTLLNLIGGIDHEFEGELLFRGEEIKDFDQYRRENVSFIFQDLNLIEHYDLIKNITIGLTNDVKDKEGKALELLGMVGLKDHVHKKPHQLSGGEKQRVAIARALARDSDILLCDEPTGSLDKNTKQEIMDLIVETFRDKTLIFITHDKDLAHNYSDQILTIENQKLIVAHTKGREDTKDINSINQIRGHYANSPDPKPTEKKSFDRRFNTNLLSKKVSIFNATYLLVIIASIFIFATGIIEGVENEVDAYLYEKYEVDLLTVSTPRFTINGMATFVNEFNETQTQQVAGFMTGIGVSTQIENIEKPLKNYFVCFQPAIADNLESNLLYGKVPTVTDEVMYSKGAARLKLYEYYTLTIVDENAQNTAIYEMLNLSDKALLEALIDLPISYKNLGKHNKERLYDPDLKLVGLIDDYSYGDGYSENEEVPYMNQGMEETFEVNGNIYVMEEAFQAYILQIYAGYNDKKFQEFNLFIEEADLDLRDKVFGDFLTHKNLIYGQDLVTAERKQYYKEMQGYKLAILGGCIILSIFAFISIYHGIQNGIRRNRRNIGIYKSLGYTSHNIRLMFLGEGLVLTIYIMTSTLILWYMINRLMNDSIIKALDPYRVIGMHQITNLNLQSVLAVVVVIMMTVFVTISIELKKVNVISLLRD